VRARRGALRRHLGLPDGRRRGREQVVVEHQVAARRAEVAVEADVAAPVPPSVERAWLAGPYLITTPPFSVSHLWGGIATPLPLAVDVATGAVVAGPGQALVRAGDRSAWLEFS